MAYTEIVSDNTRYITIEDESGKLLYDSRTEVPHDMEKWQAYRDEQRERQRQQLERMVAQVKGDIAPR